jgi:arylsulfatase A-like enzyme
MKTKIFFSISAVLVFIILSSLQTKNKVEVKKKPNIIFIAVDDLRPQLNCYGKNQIISPNIDDLASVSYIYQNAVCNFPVCGASRASLLTGLRPNKNRFTSYKTRMDIDADNILTLGEWFKKNDYFTISLGKISHQTNDSPESWSIPAWRAEKNWRDYQTKENLMAVETNNNEGAAKAFEVGDNLLDDYADTKMVNKAIEKLDELTKKEQPFFIALGFLKPHLPFNAPKKYWDLYNEKDIELASNRFKPKNAPDVSMHRYGELRKYTNIPSDYNINIPDSTQKKLIHGYYACVSYIDSEIGRLIKHLKKIDIYENSIIVLWGDHGWQLGEHNLWAKHCNYQTSLKVPLLIKYPNQKKQKRINTVVELLDIYPTLCDLGNIEKPKHLQGKSLLSINNSDPKNLNGYSKYHKGETVTSIDKSYTEWRKKDNNLKADMMYDLVKDPNENKNISKNKENYSNIIKFQHLLDSVRSLD